MTTRPIARRRVPPRVVIDFLDRHPIVVDPGAGTSANLSGHPAWITTGRSRPRYFDGRFLAARDLQRDQDYFAVRQQDELRAVGPGIVHGLEVRVEDPAKLGVSAGIAITPNGKLVVVRQSCDLDLDDLATTQRLDAAFGLLSAPRDVPRRRTGTYLLLARPVTYTADPIGLYPASIEARRAPEDGDVIEAVAFTLVPYHDRAIDVDPARVRANLARRIFVDRAAGGPAIDAVPLALVQLDRGFVLWIDSWLVRREIGTTHEGAGAFVRAPRGLAEAHVQQYREHLAAVRADRVAAHRPASFAASEELAALPPVGELPIEALDLPGATERFFPAAMPVQLQLIPEDELGALLGEQLALPPIDLSAPDEQLAVTPVAVLLPLPRTALAGIPADLRSIASLRTAAPPPGRAQVRDAVAISAIARRLAVSPATVDQAGKLVAALKAAHVDPTSAWYVRLRRAHGPIADGVAAVETVRIG